MKTKELLFGACLCMFTACNMPEKGMNVDVYEALDYCDAQVQRTLTELKAAEGTIDYSMMPRNIMDSLNTWHCRKATKDEWCSGFWPGILWYDYEYTGKAAIKEEAEKFTEPLKFLSQIPAYDHDLGFLIFCSYGNGYRLTHSPEYKQAIDGLKKYFDEGIFSPDVLDLDYASATEEFTNGNALIYYMGSWEAPLLSNKLREGNGIELENVGAMALPVAEEGGQLTVRSYIDSGIGVVDYSEKKEAAAKFVAYLTVGEGADIFGKQLTGTSAKKDFVVDETLFDTEESKAGWDTVNELINTATADRNNVSGYSDVEGAAVQSVLNGSSTTEDVLKDLQKEWTSGKY